MFQYTETYGCAFFNHVPIVQEPTIPELASAPTTEAIINEEETCSYKLGVYAFGFRS